MKEVRQLEETRAEIDATDRQILSLFLKRMKLAADVAVYKQAHGLPTFRPEREQEILEKAAGQAGPEFEDYAVRFFEGLMTLSREYQDHLRRKEDTE